MASRRPNAAVHDPTHQADDCEPVGPVGIIPPWNFPVAIPIWKVAPALAAGNTVVLKPASLAPASNAVVAAECLVDAGLPSGVLNVVYGELLGGVEAVHGFGKCAVVGSAGEIEHGSGILRGPFFGPRFRELVQGTAPIPFTERRSAPGVTMSIPTAHKTARASGAYYQAVDLTLEDAPHAKEIAIAAVSGGWAHARVGDLTTDAEWASRSTAAG